MEQIVSHPTYIGYAQRNDKILTIEFNLTEPPANYNCHYFVQKFKIISIEDFDGKIYQKIKDFSSGSNYFLRKHPLKTFLNKENLMFYDFYNNRRQLYEKYTGNVIQYTQSGNIYRQYFLNNGIIEGNYISNDENGNELENAFFVSGKRHGKTTFSSYCDLEHIYTIFCEFDMGKMISYQIELSRSSALDKIFYVRRDGNAIIFDETTGKFLCNIPGYNLEWTEINGVIDTYSITFDKLNAYERLAQITDIPYHIYSIFQPSV
jgi:hypothetical protein